MGLVVIVAIAARAQDEATETTCCDFSLTRPEFDREAFSKGLYTPEAVAQRVQGMLIVKCHVAVDGVVSNCRPIKDLPIVGPVVIARLQKTKVRPATYRGKPIARDYMFHFSFRLPNTSDDLRSSARDAGTVR